MNYYYLIGLENFIDHISCIRDLGFCYWKKSGKKMKIGDVVFLFISDKIHDKVMYRLEVSSTDEERKDSKYFKHSFKPDKHCFVLKNTSAKYDGEGLGRVELEQHGISRYVQYKKLDKEQAQWIDSFFE